jgi:D-tyrosyl-tRNA(Tyr) deacylase
MNLSALDVGAHLLVVSQFTLYGDCKKGRRPSYSAAMAPQEAKKLYQVFVTFLEGYGLPVRSGVFQEKMHVSLVNDGPVTLLIDS